MASTGRVQKVGAAPEAKIPLPTCRVDDADGDAPGHEGDEQVERIAAVAHQLAFDLPEEGGEEGKSGAGGEQGWEHEAGLAGLQDCYISFTSPANSCAAVYGLHKMLLLKSHAARKAHSPIRALDPLAPHCGLLPAGPRRGPASNAAQAGGAAQEGQQPKQCGRHAAVEGAVAERGDRGLLQDRRKDVWGRWWQSGRGASTCGGAGALRGQGSWARCRCAVGATPGPMRYPQRRPVRF